MEKDKELKTLLRELVENQRFQQKIKQTQQILEEKEYKISKLSETLENVHYRLGSALHQSSPIAKSIKESKNLNLDDVFSYAYFISRTTSEIPAFKDAELQLPPFPPPERWQFSLLYPNSLRAYKNRYLEEITAAEKELKEQKVPKINFEKFQFERDASMPPVPQTKISLFDEDSDEESSQEE
ncbi:hypothetical protein C9374_003015 [Naegleria lovaniensis]|uniref:Mediator of RNA polymerase II transcription subunit 4 n=1 Tax=Naegleria lovaniensis TaxID=51637 RepID=A0AA88GU60_NAELO|nr:uncharacterized protein C9374_003015 [Naegleria lovaniensis]KAG2385866.1 hypothetical protein C9374_003015 [Naegleria lovaniensis]